MFVAHKVNNSRLLNSLPKNCGVEIDLRMGPNNKIVLAHDTAEDKTEDLDQYLDKFTKPFLIANIKESGIEEDVIKKISDKNIDFFLLDVEIPFIVKNYKKYKKYLSIRYSEFEDINTVLNFKNMVDWVWVDTFYNLPKLDKNLNLFKKCLVSPDRWNREDDIEKYKKFIASKDFKFDAIMADLKYFNDWN